MQKKVEKYEGKRKPITNTHTQTLLTVFINEILNVYFTQFFVIFILQKNTYQTSTKPLQTFIKKNENKIKYTFFLNYLKEKLNRMIPKTQKG